MKRLIFIALMPLMLMAGCETYEITASGDDYVTFELRMNEAKTVQVGAEIYKVRLLDFEDKVDAYYDPEGECGLNEYNCIYASLKINGKNVTAYSDMGGPKPYDMTIEEAAEIMEKDLEEIKADGVNALNFAPIVSRSEEITGGCMITLDYANPARYTSSSTTAKEDYKFVFTIYSKEILP